jgi:hypothetical protein
MPNITYHTVSLSTDSIMVDGQYWGRRTTVRDGGWSSWLVCFSPDKLADSEDQEMHSVAIYLDATDFDRTIRQLVTLIPS